MSGHDYTTIPVKQETQQLVKSLKRGGESYDEVVMKMWEQYEPEPVKPNVD